MSLSFLHGPALTCLPVDALEPRLFRHQCERGSRALQDPTVPMTPSSHSPDEVSPSRQITQPVLQLP